MNTERWHMDLNPNVSNFDSYARYIAGAALIAAIFVPATTFVGWSVLLPLVAIPIVISAIIKWDPLYALLQKRPNPPIGTVATASLMAGNTAVVRRELPKTGERIAA